MADIPEVTLDIRSSNCGTPAFPTKAELVAGTPNPGNLTYSYSYGGGTDGKGNVQVETGAQAQSFKVTSRADRRYHFCDVDIGPNSTQIRCSDVSDYEVTMVDADNQAEVDYYKIKVRDTANGNCEFYCDPRVQNVVPPH